MRIEVRDSGVGIAADHLPSIFDEFYQIGVSNHGPKDGYGLGLSIVQRVVALLGLTIHIESAPGKGSAFTIDLPASADGRALAAQSASPRILRAVEPHPAMRVLVVDDDPGVRKATSMFLRSEGYSVRVAGSKDEAVQLMTTDPGIDLLITDYHLEAGETGVEVLAACRGLAGAGNLPAILLSGDTSSAVRAIGGDASLRVASKPIDPDQLMDLVAEYVVARLRQLRRSAESLGRGGDPRASLVGASLSKLHRKGYTHVQAATHPGPRQQPAPARTSRGAQGGSARHCVRRGHRALPRLR